MAEGSELNAQAIQHRVVAIILNYLDVDGTTITANSHLENDLHADSLDLTELTVAFEDEFGIEIPDSDFDRMMTVGGIVETIERHLSEK